MQMSLGRQKHGREGRIVRPDRHASGCVVQIFLMSGFTAADCQQSDAASNAAPQPEAKRIFWIKPNCRTSPVLTPYKPIGVCEKFHIVTLDSFGRGAEGQLAKANPSFGQGVPGYAQYFDTSFPSSTAGFHANAYHPRIEETFPK
jgi:hypothetical protein